MKAADGATPARPRWAAWSLLTAALLGFFVAGSLAVAGFATWIIVDDESRHDDEMDGLGTWVGSVLGGFALIVLIVAIILVTLLLRGRRRAIRDDAPASLRTIAGWILVAAGLWLVFSLLSLPLLTASLPVSLTIALPGGALLAASVGLLRATER